MSKIKGLVLPLFLFFIAGSNVIAQDKGAMFTVKNLRITIRENETVVINGNVDVLSNSDQNQNIHNEGIFIITDSLKNSVDNLFLTSSVPGLDNDPNRNKDDGPLGTVVFLSSLTNSIYGNPSIYLNDLTVKNGLLTLDTNIVVFGDIELSQGNLNLNKYHINLYDLDETINQKDGKLKPGTETDSSKIYDDSSGYIQAAILYNGKSDPANLGFKISPSSTMGNFFLTRFHNSDTSVTDGGIKKLFFIEENGGKYGDSKNIQINYLTGDLAGDLASNDSTLRIFYKEVNGRKYTYLKGNVTMYDDSIRVADAIFKPGYYTIADSICNNPPRVNLGPDQVICEGNAIKLRADTVYPEEDWPYMTYTWSSPELNLIDEESAILNIPEDIINSNLNDTLSIYLIVEDARGCVNYDTIRFFTFSSPHLNIVINKPSPNICIHDTVFFTDTKNNFGDYIWTFRSDGFQDLNDNPLYVFNNYGPNFINVLYTDTNSCAIDNTFSVMVHSLPEPSFIVSEGSCIGQELFLDNNSYIDDGSIKKYSWDMGNGNQIEITQDTIISDSTLNFVTEKIVSKYINGIPGPDLIYYYNQPGIYGVKLMAESFGGCIYDTTITTQVYDSVYASFETSSLTNVCLGLESRFFSSVGTSDTNLVAEYQWHFRDTVIIANNLDDTINYTFKSSGSHEVSFVAVSKHGCSNSVTKTVSIYPSPAATFKVNPVCLNNASLFNSTGSDTTSINYTWYFEDTTIYKPAGTALNYRFRNAGNHEVKLEVSFVNGCTTDFIDSALVLENPESNFIVSDACINNQLTDTILINTSNNLNSTYEWDFGDGTTSENKQPLKVYKEAGNFKVRLEAITKYTINSSILSCNSVYTDSIEIYDIVKADFKVGGYTNVCEGTASVFELETISLNPNIDYYEWQFETDTQTISNPINYTFSSDGIYNVTLKTVTKNGCVDEKMKSVEIYETPTASMISDSVCFGEELTFSIPENDRNPNDVYNWYLEGDYVGTGWYASVDKLLAGTYEMILNVESQNACINKDTSYAVVHELPEDMFQPEIDVCTDTFQIVGKNPDYQYLWNSTWLSNEYIVRTDEICTVEKTDKITGCQSSESILVRLNKPLNVDLGNDTSACGSIQLDAGYYGSSATYQWSNGATSRYINVNVTGKYKVVVYMGDCFASDSVNVTVNSQPTLELGQDIEVCALETVNLNAQIPEGDIYLWSNGTTLSNIDITSDTPISSIFGVTVTDINGCVVADKVKVTFNPNPNVDLGPDIETCQNVEIALNATVVNATGYLWNNEETTPVIFVSENSENVITKSYNVNVENIYGCVSKDTISIQFNPIPEIILQDQVACGNEVIILDAYVEGAISYNWNNGSIDSILTIDPQIDGEGVYYVTIENNYNCISTSNQSNVTFRTAPIPVLIDEITGCNEISIDAGNFGSEFFWNDNVTTQTRDVYQSGLYTVKITNSNNCVIEDSIDVTINYVTKPYLGPDLSLCENKQLILRTGLHDPEYNFVWNGYSTGDTMLVATPGTYIVQALHSNGCEDSDTIKITGRSLPIVDLGPDMYKCTDDNFILDAGTDGYAYNWGNTEGLEAYSRLLEVSDTGKYWVQVTNDFGCVKSDTIEIKPTNLSIDPSFVTNSKLIAGDSVLFIDMSHPEPLNWLWEFGDLQQSILQNPVHVYYGGGSYQVIMHVSNSICNASIIKIIEVEHRNKSGSEDEDEGTELFGDKFIEIQNVKIYPNPNNGNFTIEAELSTRSNAHVYIFDLMGRLISIRKYSDVEIVNQDVDMQSKSSGIYIIKIIAGTDHKTYKIIKQ